MNTNNNMKSTVEDIRNKFDKLAENYSNIEQGQSTALDSPLCLELIAKAASTYNPDASKIADIGCGGGNYMVKLTSLLPNVDVTLVDLSANMLATAARRVNYNISGNVTTIQSDFREMKLEKNAYDVIVAATSLHHLRTEAEWEQVFAIIYNALKPGGSFWINDVIIEENQVLDQYMYQNWLRIITDNLGKETADYIAEQFAIEDTPQTLNFQLDLMKKLGFRETHILHKHFCFAAFGAIK